MRLRNFSGFSGRTGAGDGPAAALCRRSAWTACGMALLMAPALALGQPETRPPVDVNRVQPQPQPAAPVPGQGAAPAADAATPGPTGALERDGKRYAISRFVLEYHSEQAGHVNTEELMGARVKLGVLSDGYVEWREGLPAVELRVGDMVDASGGVFYRSGINAVGKAIAEELNKRGQIGIFAQIHPDDVENATGDDKREGKRTEMRLIIWTGVITEVRAVTQGERLHDRVESGETPAINPDDKVLNRIRRESPVQAGDLLLKDEMDRYVFRLNRHPGRRVDVALSPGGEPEEVVVDYLVAESKPWSAYFQLSNTGTRETNTIRERFGFVHNQLSGHDDVLRIDYITGGFSDANSVAVNYEFPLISNKLRLRAFGSFSQFDASDVGGLNGEQFSGETYAAGLELEGTIYQRRELFLDVIGGARYENVHVENSTARTDGQTNFVIPYVGLRLDRNTEASSTFAGLTLEIQEPGLGGTDNDEVQNLGRQTVDDQWQVLKFSAEHSFYLEPLLNPRGYSGSESGGAQTLAHEISASVRGQVAFGQRLIPNEEEVAGGLFSVRGYRESATAGDTVVIGSLEYRFHIPRILPIADAGHFRWFGDEGAGRPMGWFGKDFRYNPQQPFGRPDWDLIFRAFLDGARVVTNDQQTGEENDSLLGTGIGLEYDHKRNVSARLDFGVPLRHTADRDTEQGDCRLHFSITLLY